MAVKFTALYGEIPDGSVTPQKTNFINGNILYENALIEVVGNNQQWKNKEIKITDNFEVGAIYTLLVEEATNYTDIMTCVVQAFSSDGTKLKGISTNVPKHIAVRIAIPENTSYVKLIFYASGNTANSGTAYYKNVRFIKGEKDIIEIDKSINVSDGILTPQKLKFIENNIIFEQEVIAQNATNQTWIAYKKTYTDLIVNETYTLLVDEITGAQEDIDVINIQVFDSNGKQLRWNSTKKTANISLSIVIPPNTARVELIFYVCNSTYTGTAYFKNVRFVKGKVPALTIKDFKLNSSSINYVSEIYKNYNLPILYLDGDLKGITDEVKKTFNYVYGERSGTCTLKWQGSSSLSYPKKNYTINFDNAFEAKNGWGSQNKYCLKANYIDYTHARNVVSAKLWGQIVKERTNVPTELSNLVNGGAVDGFPCCLVINGEYQGLYTFNIPKDAWLFGMGSGTNECIVCAENYKFNAQALLDKTDVEIEYISNEDNTSWAITSFNNIYNALTNATKDNFEETLGQYLDIDSAIDYYIFMVLITGIDINIKNWIMAKFDTSKWFMSAYDLDSTYGLFWDGTKFLTSKDRYTFLDVSYHNELFKKLKLYCKDKIKSRYTNLRKSVLSEDNVNTTFLNFVSGIPKALYDEELKLWNGIPSTASNNVQQIITNFNERCKYIDKEVENL